MSNLQSSAVACAYSNLSFFIKVSSDEDSEEMEISGKDWKQQGAGCHSLSEVCELEQFGKLILLLKNNL